jgi:hypothetical protein
MEDGRIDLFATGKYLDEIVLDAGAAKFAERIVVLDSRNVDILMVVPLRRVIRHLRHLPLFVISLSQHHRDRRGAEVRCGPF